MLAVRAVHTFVAEHGDELDFEAGDLIEVLEKDDAFGDGWWRVRSPRHCSHAAADWLRERMVKARRACSQRPTSPKIPYTPTATATRCRTTTLQSHPPPMVYTTRSLQRQRQSL